MACVHAVTHHACARELFVIIHVHHDLQCQRCNHLGEQLDVSWIEATLSLLKQDLTDTDVMVGKTTSLVKVDKKYSA